MGTPTPLAFRPETAAEVLHAARARRRAADDAEADLLRLAVDWASMHAADSLHPAATQVLRGFRQTDLALAGEGAPTVAEFAVAEFAVAIGLSTEAGKSFLGEALELPHRLPGLWERVTRGDLSAWKPRRVARETVRLSAEAASYVDTHAAPWPTRSSPPSSIVRSTRPSAVHARGGRASGGGVVGQAPRHPPRPAGLLHRHHARRGR